MERTEILGLMGELKLFGMRGAFDEVMTTALKRQHEPPRIVGSPARLRDTIGDLLDVPLERTLRDMLAEAA